MQSFIYTVHYTSKIKGFNRTVTVYQLVDNHAVYIDTNDRINTSSYPGDLAVACQLISDKLDLPMKDCYELEGLYRDISVRHVGL